MTQIDIREAEANLARYVERVEAGETVVLCRDDRPIAEIRPVVAEGKRQRRIPGIDKGKITILPEFFDPLPEDMLHVFNGEGE